MNEIIGQDRAIASLAAASAGNRRHHALIFSGPRGVGKFTSAVNYASSLLKIPEGEHFRFADLHIIKKEDVAWSQNPSLQKKKQTNIPLDLLREKMIGGKTSDDKICGAPVFMTPSVGSEKVFIIDEAELIVEDVVRRCQRVMGAVHPTTQTNKRLLHALKKIHALETERSSRA